MDQKASATYDRVQNHLGAASGLTVDEVPLTEHPAENPANSSFLSTFFCGMPGEGPDPASSSSGSNAFLDLFSFSGASASAEDEAPASVGERCKSPGRRRTSRPIASPAAPPRVGEGFDDLPPLIEGKSEGSVWYFCAGAPADDTSRRAERSPSDDDPEVLAEEARLDASRNREEEIWGAARWQEDTADAEVAEDASSAASRATRGCFHWTST